MTDTIWIEETRRRLKAQATTLDNVLERAGMTVIGGTALFRLVQSESARDVIERLGKAGIFVRRFPDRPQWLRFGLPGPEQALARLKQALG